MELRAKRGLNQKGICYTNSLHSDFDQEVCRVGNESSDCLVDIRLNDNIASEMIVLDQRVFDKLGLVEDDTVVVTPIGISVPSVSEVFLCVNSSQGLDNSKVAQAISKRVNDFREDFDGLVLRNGDSIRVDRLGLSFEVREIKPSSPARILWTKLGNIRLIPEAEASPMNLVCVMEVGGASHIEDVHGAEGLSSPRYRMYLDLLDDFSSARQRFGRDRQFAGLAFSDDVHFFETYDSDTGQSREIAFLESRSLIFAYKVWIQEILPTKRRSPSDLGHALSDAIEVAERMRETNDLPTAVVVFSSGVFSTGPNPVKTIRRAQGQTNLGFFFFYSGEGVELDIIEAMANKVDGTIKKIDTTEDIEGALKSIDSWVMKKVFG